MDEEKLQRMLEEAASKGARKALREVGLEDHDALKDVIDLRDLIKSWRAVKLTVTQTFVRIFIYAILLSVLGNAGYQFIMNLK